MKRPFAVIGFSFLAAASAASFLGANLTIYCACAAFLLFLISLLIKPLRKHKVIPAIALTCTIALAGYVISFLTIAYPAQQLNGQTATITAALEDHPYQKDNRIYYPLKTSSISIESAPQEVSMLLSSDVYMEMDYYDNITVEVQFYSSEVTSFRNNQTAKGIYISAFNMSDTYLLEETEEKPLKYYPLKLNQALTHKIQSLLPPDQAALTTALFLGNKHELSKNLQQAFNYSGVSHVIVVSGLHLSVLCAFVYGLLKRLMGGRKLCAVITIGVILLFMTITGFSPSVMRCGIMMIILMISRLFSKTKDSLSALGIAALILCVQSPLCGGDVGLLMSFTSTLGILIFNPRLYRFCARKISRLSYGKRALKPVAEVLCVSASAVIFSFPITLFTFGTFNIYFLISNLLIAPLMTVVLIAILAMLLLAFIPFVSFLAYIPALIAGVVCNYFILITGTVSSLPFANVDIDTPAIYIWFFITLFIIIINLIKGKGKIRRLAVLSLSSVGVLLVCVSVQGLLTQHNAVLTVYNTNGGITATVEKDGQYAILSCGGSRGEQSNILYQLSSISTQPSLLSVAGKKQEQNAYAISLISQFDPEKILVYDTNNYSKALSLELNALKEDITYYNQPFTVSLWEDIQLFFVPCGDGGAWVYVTINGQTVLLCPSGGNAYELPGLAPKANIVVVAQVPAGIEQFSQAQCILACSEEDFSSTYDILSEKNVTPDFFTGNGNIYFTNINNEVSLWQN